MDSGANNNASGERTLDVTVIDLAIRLGIIALLSYLALSLVAPFVVIGAWAVILAVAIYPIHTWMSAKLGGRSKLVSFLITIVGLGIITGPMAVLAASLLGSVDTLSAAVKAGALPLPMPSESIKDWPLVGERIYGLWMLAGTNLSAFFAQNKSIIQDAGGMLLGWAANLGSGLLMFALSIIISGFLYGAGPKLVAGARRLATRIVADRGEAFIDLAGATIRNVSRGVIGISLLQTILAGIGLILAGIPAAGLIALGVLLLGIIQVGPGILLIPVIIWVWTAMDTVTAVLFTLYMLPVTLVDNILKPIVMAKGLNTPMLVIFIGVIGGTLTQGLIGLFLGPIVLAVFYELLVAWVGESENDTKSSDTEGSAA